MSEIAREFRYALATDLEVAESLFRKRPELIDYPVYGDSESALHFFATENRADIVAWLIDHGANPNGIADDNFPLHAACQLGHLEVCRVLLGAGAKPNLKDFVEETALHKASCTGRLEILELLLNSGADPSITEMCGELPVDQALPRKSDEVRSVFDRHASSTHTKA